MGTPHEAARIRLQLQQHFGADSVFIDRKIPPGQEFDKYLEVELKSCDALVAVMGNDFFRTKRKKTEEPKEETDYVRWEIETALQMGVPVFPIIVGKHEMPRERDLPESLKAYAKKQALYAVDPAFDSAIDELVKELKTIGLVSRQDDASFGAEAGSIQVPKKELSDIGPLSSVFGKNRFQYLGFAIIALTFFGLVIDQMSQGLAPDLSNAPRYFLLGLVFTTTTVSITFCPLWFYKLVNVTRARLYLNVGTVKSVVVTCSAASMWITNTVFLSLATNRNFEYTFLGSRLPTWLYIVMGLFGTLWIALLAMWEVSLNTKQQRSLGLTLIFSIHTLNCLFQVALLVLILRYVAAGDANVLNGLMLYLTACVCGTATFWVSSAWREFFSTNGSWSLILLSGTLAAAWVFLTMTSYAHFFAPLVL